MLVSATMQWCFLVLLSLSQSWSLGPESGLVTLADPQGSGLTYDCGYCQPEQIHIAFGEKTNDIVVTWSTFDNPNASTVFYGVGSLTQEVKGQRTLFRDGGHEKRTQIIHRVTLQDLNFDTRYTYMAGSPFGWSELLTFKIPPQGEEWTPSAAIYGDLGVKNSRSLSYLQMEAEQFDYNLIFHIGDMAYDMDSDNARVGDQFMRQIEPIAASLPYMVCPGNHEEKYNFSNYRNRFSMPGGTESLFYSFNLGPVHFVSISTEFYYYLKYGFHLLVNQYDWIENDLMEANKAENRAKRPWIIVFGHRPMYTSDAFDPQQDDQYTRTGLPPMNNFGLEHLLRDYGVDVAMWAHEHSYERTWPLYDGKVYNGSLEQPYVNPGAPVHIITGSAGSDEAHSSFNKNVHPWSAFRTIDYGYTRFKAYNKTHIYFEQVSVEKAPIAVVDSFWIVKEKHGPYENLV